VTVNNGDVIRVSARFAMSSGQDHVNVFHYQTDPFGATEDDATVMSEIHDQLDSAYSNITAHLSNTASPVDLKFDIVEFIGGVETIVRNLGLIPFDVTTPPGGTGEALPPGNAGLVKMLTGIGKVYGRKYVGMLLEGGQNGGTLGASLLTALDVFGGIVYDSFAGAAVTYLAGVMSKKLAEFVPFIEYEVNPEIAYQRRRRPGTGS